MAAQPTVADIPDDQHPAVLLVRAHELVAEADELDKQIEEMRAKARELRVQAGVMRARAARLRDGEHLAPPKRKAEPPDPLMAAAGLAVEDFMGVFTTREFMEVLQLRNEDRALKLLRSLREMELITEVGEDWRTWEVEEARVRDTLRDLGTCSQAELAEALDVPLEAVQEYLKDGVRHGWVDVAHDGHLMYLRPGPERTITRHPHRALPEKDRPAYSEAPYRGEPVRVVHHGRRGAAMSNPGERHKIKLKDAARERQENARRERAAAQAAKQAKANAAGRKRK